MCKKVLLEDFSLTNSYKNSCFNVAVKIRARILSRVIKRWRREIKKVSYQPPVRLSEMILAIS